MSVIGPGAESADAPGTEPPPVNLVEEVSANSGIICHVCGHSGRVGYRDSPLECGSLQFSSVQAAAPIPHNTAAATTSMRRHLSIEAIGTLLAVMGNG